MTDTQPVDEPRDERPALSGGWPFVLIEEMPDPDNPDQASTLGIAYGGGVDNETEAIGMLLAAVGKLSGVSPVNYWDTIQVVTRQREREKRATLPGKEGEGTS